MQQAHAGQGQVQEQGDFEPTRRSLLSLDCRRASGLFGRPQPKR